MSSIESFGKVILESIFSGTPVIAFNQYAAKDIITHKIDGYLVNNKNSIEILHGINFMDKNFNFEKFKNEVKHKISKFEIKEVTNQYIELYNKI